MRRLVLFLIVLNALFLLGQYFRPGGGFQGAGAQAVVQVQNGDTNGDGLRDISDAISLLNWLFTGGPEPVACAQESGLSAEQAQVLSHFHFALINDGKGGSFPTIQIVGANVQILSAPFAKPNGTSTRNGLGNLIVGFQEARGGGTDIRTGSHNIIVGSRNNYSSFGGLVVGDTNALSGPYASVSGGKGNLASGDGSSVSGGFQNTASGLLSSISGGNTNRAQGDFSSVSGGEANNAGVAMTSISGGFQNNALGPHSAIGGGSQNETDGMFSVVSGGRGHNAFNDFDWKAGGLFQDE